MTRNENKNRKIVVKAIRGLSPRVRAIRFGFVDKTDAKEFAFEPGSFVMVSVPGYGESPLTITTSPSELPEFEVAVRSVGDNTTALNRLKVGETAYIRGPLGNHTDFKDIYGRELLVVGGGIGLAPLRSIIRYLGENPDTVSRLTILHGAKNPDELIFKDEVHKWQKFADVHLVVDKADPEWEGELGNVVKSLEKLSFDKQASAIVCGPPVMYKPIAKSLAKKGFNDNDIYFMLERKMKCGTGKCQHCTCGDKYVCLDGPTFRYSEIKDNPEAFI